MPGGSQSQAAWDKFYGFYRAFSNGRISVVEATHMATELMRTLGFYIVPVGRETFAWEILDHA
jgi:hypothetical protein